MKNNLHSNENHFDSDLDANKKKINIAEQGPTETDEEYQIRFFEELKEHIKTRISSSGYIELLRFIQKPEGLDAITKRCIRIMVEQNRKLGTALADIETELEGRS